MNLNNRLILWYNCDYLFYRPN